MHILITGGAGFFMGNVLDRLLVARPSAQITALESGHASTYSASNATPRLRWVQADVSSAPELDEALAGQRFDVDIHAAALSNVPRWELRNPRHYLDVNVMGTANLLDCMRHAARPLTRIIHVSSNAVYGDDWCRAPMESPTPSPGEMYGISKLTGEWVAQRYRHLFRLPIVVVRPGKLYGPRERPTHSRAQMSAPFKLVAAAMGGDTLRVSHRSLRASRDWLSATDAASVVYRLAMGAGRDGATYDVAYGRTIPFREMIRLAEALAGRSVVELNDVDPDLDLEPAGLYGRDAPGDIRAAMRDLTWEPREWEQQFADYFAWARQSPDAFAPDPSPEATT